MLVLHTVDKVFTTEISRAILAECKYIYFCYCRSIRIITIIYTICTNIYALFTIKAALYMS